MRRRRKVYLLRAAFSASASLSYLRDAEAFSLCYANIAFVSTNPMAVPTLSTSLQRLLTQVEAPSQQNIRGQLYPHSLRLQGLFVWHCSIPLSSSPFELMRGKMKAGVERQEHTCGEGWEVARVLQHCPVPMGSVG